MTFSTSPPIQRRPRVKGEDIASRPISNHTKMTSFLIKPALLAILCCQIFQGEELKAIFFFKRVCGFIVLKLQYREFAFSSTFRK